MQCFNLAHHCFPGADREQLRQEEQPTGLNHPQACHRDRHSSAAAKDGGLPRATPSLWVRLWKNRMVLLGITARRAGKGVPWGGSGFCRAQGQTCLQVGKWEKESSFPEP